VLAYDVLRLLHLVGVVLLVGNVTVTSIWKLYADGTRDPVVIAFSQRLVTITDWFFTFWGILLLILGGYGAAWVAGMDVLRDDWIVWSEIMFAIAGALWLFVLVPVQVAQARMARGFVAGRPIPEAYFRLGRVWIAVGSVATVPLVAAMWLMLRKGW
jgi:uncharacterized membrane protein